MVVGVNFPMAFVHAPSKAGPKGFVLVFLCLPGYWDSLSASFLLPLAPLSEGEARSGRELGERLGRDPAAGRFPPLRGGVRRAGESRKQLGSY